MVEVRGTRLREVLGEAAWDDTCGRRLRRADLGIQIKKTARSFM